MGDLARHTAAVAFVGEELKKGRAWASLPYAYDYEEDGMLYLHCYDDNPKKPTAARLAEACAAYEARFGEKPDLILISEQDAGATRDGCEVRVEKRVGPNNYHVGRTE
jgi:hypothetical protein